MTPTGLRHDGRAAGEARALQIRRGVLKHAEGSVLITVGDTQVLCAASVENSVPAWLRGMGRGWVTAEYAMLPRSTHERTPREVSRGRQSGRTMEIQRLVGRALRAGFDLALLGERTIWVDCDVIQADGGTRTAAITGGFVAAVDAVASLVEAGELRTSPLRDFIAATSVGIVGDELLLDLDYAEDSTARFDLNVVATGDGRVVEAQGTAEGEPVPRESLDELLDMALRGIANLVLAQKAALGSRAGLVAAARAEDVALPDGPDEPREGAPAAAGEQGGPEH